MSIRRVCLAALLSAFFASGIASSQTALLPMPREFRPGNAVQAASVEIVCKSCDAEDTFAAAELREVLAERGVSAGGDLKITLLRASSSEGKSALSSAGVQWTPEMDAEGYVIVPEKHGLTVIGATASGVFYGAQTVKQLFDTTGSTASLQLATVRDWPSLKIRGLDDDLSRGPVPTLEYQKKQIRTIASFKLNLYSPYFEHTMQYLSNPLSSPPGGSVSAADARELVAYAAKYHITVVPEQEAFGHVHYILNNETYANLAETPHGQVMAPGQPGSLKLIKEMFAELAQIYPSPYLHIGADETQELGLGQTKADVDARKLGAVYLDYMQKIVAELKPLNRRLLFWGDIARHDPDLVKALPQSFKDATIAVAWEYNPQPKGYGPWIKPFTNAGMECWVSPGVNNWSRVYPNYNMGLQNIYSFTLEGKQSGCTGQMNTIWNDDGEGLADMNWYGIVAGATAAWQGGSGSIEDFQKSYGRVFHNDPTGKVDQAQREMMVAHQILKDNFKKSDGSDLLFWLDPWSKDGQAYASLLRPYLTDVRLHSEKAIVLVRQARMQGHLREDNALDAIELGARRMNLLALKFQVTDEIAAYYAQAEKAQRSAAREDRTTVGRLLNTINSPNGKLQDLRDGYSLTRDLYQQAWLKSNRPYWLTNNLERYDMTIQLWLGRMDKVRSAQRQWQTTQTIPSAAELGIPAPATKVF